MYPQVFARNWPIAGPSSLKNFLIDPQTPSIFSLIERRKTTTGASDPSCTGTNQLFTVPYVFLIHPQASLRKSPTALQPSQASILFQAVDTEVCALVRKLPMPSKPLSLNHPATLPVKLENRSPTDLAAFLNQSPILIFVRPFRLSPIFLIPSQRLPPEMLVSHSPTPPKMSVKNSPIGSKTCIAKLASRFAELKSILTTDSTP